MRALCAGHHTYLSFFMPLMCENLQSNSVSPLNALAPRLQAREQRAAAAVRSPTQAKASDNHSVRTSLTQEKQPTSSSISICAPAFNAQSTTLNPDVDTTPTNANTSDSHSLRTSLLQENNVYTSLLQESSIPVAASVSAPHSSTDNPEVGYSDAKVNFRSYAYDRTRAYPCFLVLTCA
jgi:hypothetical protein